MPGGAGRDVIYGDGRSNSIGANSHAVAQVVGGADFIDGGAEADALWGDGIATAIGFHAAVLHGGNDRIVGGQGDDSLWGDGAARMRGEADASLVGGADRLQGGAGSDRLLGDGEVRIESSVGTSYAAELVGGDDRLYGESGNDVLIGDGSLTFVDIEAELATAKGSAGIEAPALIRGVLSLVGGDDWLQGREGDDTLWGDGSVEGGASGTMLQGGADVFAFALGEGRDRIEDFRASDGDRIWLGGTGIAWATLDSDANGVLNEDDAATALSAGDLSLDLGLAAGAEAGSNLVILTGVAQLVQTDFIL